MIKCIFLLKENNGIKEVIETKIEKEINKILTDGTYFSIKNVDEYIFLDRSFSKQEQEQLVLPYLLSQGSERLKQ